MKFSERLGIVPVKSIQIESIDDDLKNSLWNCYKTFVFPSLEQEEKISDFSNALWIYFFKENVDYAPNKYDLNSKLTRKYYDFNWYKTYEFIEFIFRYISLFEQFEEEKELFVNSCNSVLEREKSAYRFVSGKIVPITNDSEIAAINEAQSNTQEITAFRGANIHLKTALSKLADKQKPDYRNSIKESISAIETLAKVIAGDEKAELGKAIDKIKGPLRLHGALAQGLKQIYGYTSDAAGIRHGLMDEPNCDFEDAKFMLVSCSAFVNFLIMKAQKAGISFEK